MVNHLKAFITNKLRGPGGSSMVCADEFFFPGQPADEFFLPGCWVEFFSHASSSWASFSPLLPKPPQLLMVHPLVVLFYLHWWWHSLRSWISGQLEAPCRTTLKAIACSGDGKMKMDRFIIEHLGLLRVVVVICDISCANKLSIWNS